MYVLFVYFYHSDHQGLLSQFEAFSINLIFQNIKHAIITLFPDAFGAALSCKVVVQYALLSCWWVVLV